LVNKSKVIKIEERVKIINIIIKVISENGRKFFFDEKTKFTSYVFYNPKTKKCYFKDDYTKQDVCLSPPWGKPSKHFSHGGTMWGLLRDFKDFIHNGPYTNHNHGYGGLYGTAWGYNSEEMKKIQETAINLGYLKQREEEIKDYNERKNNRI